MKPKPLIDPLDQINYVVVSSTFKPNSKSAIITLQWNSDPETEFKSIEQLMRSEEEFSEAVYLLLQKSDLIRAH